MGIKDEFRLSFCPNSNAVFMKLTFSPRIWRNSHYRILGKIHFHLIYGVLTFIFLNLLLKYFIFVDKIFVIWFRMKSLFIPKGMKWIKVYFTLEIRYWIFQQVLVHIGNCIKTIFETGQNGETSIHPFTITLHDNTICYLIMSELSLAMDQVVKPRKKQKFHNLQ